MPKRTIHDFCIKHKYVGLHEPEAIAVIPEDKLKRIEHNDAEHLKTCKGIKILEW